MMNQNVYKLSTFVFKTFVLAAVIAAAFPEFSFAATGLEESVANVSGSMKDMPIVLSGIAYLAGGATMLSGAGLLKKHADNPASTPLMQGMSRMVAGGFVAALPVGLEWAIKTLSLMGTCGDGQSCAVYVPFMSNGGKFGFGS